VLDGYLLSCKPLRAVAAEDDADRDCRVLQCTHQMVLCEGCDANKKRKRRFEELT
jgi:hypothetical protein